LHLVPVMPLMPSRSRGGVECAGRRRQRPPPVLDLNPPARNPPAAAIRRPRLPRRAPGPGRRRRLRRLLAGEGEEQETRSDPAGVAGNARESRPSRRFGAATRAGSLELHSHTFSRMQEGAWRGCLDARDAASDHVHRNARRSDLPPRAHRLALETRHPRAVHHHHGLFLRRAGIGGAASAARGQVFGRLGEVGELPGRWFRGSYLRLGRGLGQIRGTSSNRSVSSATFLNTGAATTGRRTTSSRSASRNHDGRVGDWGEPTNEPL